MESKEQLLSKLLEGVKGCQSRFGSRSELATEDDGSVSKLCLAYENVFLHGFKVPEKSRSLWQMTENLVPSGLRLPTENPSFWPLIKSHLSKHEAERFLLLHNVRTDYGRARAWLRASLNEHSLEKYILLLLSTRDLAAFYEVGSFLVDPELAGILPQTAAGLGSVLFALVVDNPALDCWVKPAKEDVVASPVEVAEVADQFLAALRKESESSSKDFGATPTNSKYSSVGKKKKRKPHVNVVSFDDEGVVSQQSSRSKSVTSQDCVSPSSHSSSTTTPTPTPVPTDSSISSPVQISASNLISVTNTNHNFDDASLHIYSTSAKSADCISVNSVYSDCSERLELESGPGNDLNFGRISPSQRLIPVRDESMSGGGGGISLRPPEDGQDGDSCSENLNLIPVPNFDHENELRTNSAAPELQIDLDLSMSAPTPTRDSVQTVPTSPISPQMSQSFTSRDNISINSNSIDARISSSGGGDEERIVKLKAVLDREIEMVASLQALLAEEKRKSRDQVKILEARVESLGKENEVLKHQLNKYIGAVQLLKKERRQNKGMGRRGSSFEEEEGDENILNLGAGVGGANSISSGSVDEGAEYERKLIQVAEMHGELMEFNAHLQTSLRRRDVAIRRLKEELVDLRGPLSGPFLDTDTGGGQELDDGSWDIVDSSSAHSGDLGGSTGSGVGSGALLTLGHPRRQIHLTHNERVLINIWIPSAFLTGANTDLHHVYQVFLRIKDTEWNVYRRYSQFYSLHRDLKKRDSVIGTFYFPPKKHLGNKDGKFVDERRRKLQDYLRQVINHTLQNNSVLAAHPDKNLLISIFPFFGENTFSHQKKKERSRGRLFFRPSTSSAQVHNSPSGFQTQSTQYPQYTGL